jgi:HEAT repeat protein
MRATLVIWLLGAAAWAQDGGETEIVQDGCGSGDEGETEIVVTETDDGAMEIVVDPFFEAPEEVAEPNRPPAVKVGLWPAPKLKPEDQRRHERLEAARDKDLEDVAARYRLAEFYLELRWYPYAAEEFKVAARLDPTSIRPWEGLLRVYRIRPAETHIIEWGPGRVIERRESRNDWLSSRLERDQLIERAYEELLKRRPEALEYRRACVAHLKSMGLYPRMAHHAREALKLIPGDPVLRYELAEALRLVGKQKSPDTQGKGTPEWDAALRELEGALKDGSRHIRTRLRLVRMLAFAKGNAAEKRVIRLEQAAFFELFVRAEIAPVARRADTQRLARALCGPSMANTLWDKAMGVDELRGGADRRYHVRWIHLAFPKAHPRERKPVIESLARRADASAAGLLLALLWNLDETYPPANFPPGFQTPSDHASQLEAMAIPAAGGLGPACYAGAEKFLRAADTNVRRRRGVQLLAAIGDKRAVQPLLETLQRDTDKRVPLAVAAALEALGDPAAIDALCEAALDVRRPVPRRREAVEALAVFRDPRAIEVLKKLEKDPEFAFVAAYGLFRQTGDEQALARMRELHGGQVGSADALRMAAKCESPRIVELMLDVVEKGDPEAQTAVVALLRKRFWKRAEPLLQLVKSAKGETWKLAAEALAETGDPRAVRHFNRMRILDRDEYRREKARELHGIAAKRQAERARKQ